MIGKIEPLIGGNVGFVFTNDDLPVIRDLILANRVPAPARAGAMAPVDVVVPAGIHTIHTIHTIYTIQTTHYTHYIHYNRSYRM